MEVYCSSKSIVGGTCGSDSRDRRHEEQVVPLLSCERDISNHFNSVMVFLWSRERGGPHIVPCSYFQDTKFHPKHDCLSTALRKTRRWMETAVNTMQNTALHLQAWCVQNQKICLAHGKQTFQTRFAAGVTTDGNICSSWIGYIFSIEYIYSKMFWVLSLTRLYLCY